DTFEIERVLPVELLQIEQSLSHVFKTAGPSAASFANATVFQVPSCNSRGGERSAKMTGMCEVIAGAPVSAVDVHRNRMRAGSRRLGEAQISKLARVTSVMEAGIGLWWRKLQNRGIFLNGHWMGLH